MHAFNHARVEPSPRDMGDGGLPHDDEREGRQQHEAPPRLGDYPEDGLASGTPDQAGVGGRSGRGKYGSFVWVQVYYPLFLLEEIAHLTKDDPFSVGCVITGKNKPNEESNDWRVNCFHPIIPRGNRW